MSLYCILVKFSLSVLEKAMNLLKSWYTFTVQSLFALVKLEWFVLEVIVLCILLPAKLQNNCYFWFFM
jgi:hypothetical protein